MKDKLNKFLPGIALGLAIISIFLIKFSYISIIISVFTIVSSICFSRKNIRLLITTIIISIASIITNSIILYNDYMQNVDIFKDVNFLIGTWDYNEYGGVYIFNDDFTYTQYGEEDTSDNYCIGNYEYSYGGSSDNGTVIMKDDNYYYYDLILKEQTCFILGKEDNERQQKKLVIGININDYDDLIFMDTKNNNAYKVVKITN